MNNMTTHMPEKTNTIMKNSMNGNTNTHNTTYEYMMKTTNAHKKTVNNNNMTTMKKMKRMHKMMRAMTAMNNKNNTI